MCTHVIVNAREWFQRSCGNAYHNVDVLIYENGKKTHSFTSGIRYGGTRAYIATARNMLGSAGILSESDMAKSYYLNAICRDKEWTYTEFLLK